MYPSRKNSVPESNGPTLKSMKSPRPLFFVFFLLGAVGPLIYAANLSGNGHHAPLALFIIPEVVVFGFALFFGLRGRSK